LFGEESQIAAAHPAASCGVFIKNNKGVTLAAQGKYDEAIQVYDEIILFDLENVDTWNNKGVAYGMKGKYVESLGCFEEAIRRDPTDVAAWSNKGYVLELLSRNSEAEVAYTKARELGWTG
jgi:Flp pilus assembly protein TadD